MLDLDHDRCRRTDGRKWRCYQSVVPNQKYCEKHMHRGRGCKRSRKLVEDVTLDKPSVTENLSKKPKSTPGYEISAIFSKTLQPLSGPSRAVIKCPDFANTSAKMIERNVTNIEGNLNKFVDEKIAAVNLASGLTFSPRSVLQDGQRCLETNRHVKASWEVPRRCGRTDGRKWQCQNKALLTQKYCALHINRGQKKGVMSLLPYGEAKAALVTSSATKLSSLQPEMGLQWDTDLTISLPIVLPHSGPKVRDSASDRTSSRDPSIETTNSDDCADIPNLIDVSP